MMKNHIKTAFSLLIIAVILIACNSDKSDKDKEKKQNTTKQKDTVQIGKDQYRIAEQFTGSKNQIIDLIKGPANFVIVHQGAGTFQVRLMTSEGNLIDVLADVTGDYNGKKKIEVPETTAYILDVKTEGVWSVYRE